MQEVGEESEKNLDLNKLKWLTKFTQTCISTFGLIVWPVDFHHLHTNSVTTILSGRTPPWTSPVTLKFCRLKLSITKLRSTRIGIPTEFRIKRETVYHHPAAESLPQYELIICQPGSRFSIVLILWLYSRTG
jgi:hypothetical protein